MNIATHVSCYFLNELNCLKTNIHTMGQTVSKWVDIFPKILQVIILAKFFFSMFMDI